MRRHFSSAALSILLLSSGSSVYAREDNTSEANRARIDKIVFHMMQFNAKFPSRLCGNDYSGPSEEQRLEAEAMRIFQANAKEEMIAMGPRAIPLLMEGLNANCRLVQETMIDTLAVMGQPVFVELEECLNDGSVSDFRGAGSDFPLIIEILKESKSDSSKLISDMLKSPKLNCKLFALEAMSKLRKNIPALSATVEKLAGDIHENIRAAAVEALAVDAKSNKSHFDLVCRAIENDETSLVRTKAINAMSLFMREFSKEDQDKYKALLLRVYETDHVKKVRDYASSSLGPNRLRRANDEQNPTPVFRRAAKDSIYSRPLPKVVPLDAAKESAMNAAVLSILQQIKDEHRQMKANYNPRMNRTPEYRGSSNFNYYKYERQARAKELELRNLGPNALEALIANSNVANVDAEAACATAIKWFDYDALPFYSNALETTDDSFSLGSKICSVGARANAVFEQVLSEGSENAKLNVLAILSYQLPRLNHHKTIYNPIEVTPKLIKLVEKCINSSNTKLSEEAKIVREQIDFSQCVLLTGH